MKQLYLLCQFFFFFKLSSILWIKNFKEKYKTAHLFVQTLL